MRFGIHVTTATASLQPTGPQGGPIQLAVREMTDEQLLALIAQEQAKLQALPVESAPLPEALPPPGSPETAAAGPTCPPR
jgi:hypothetical protein